MFMKYLRLILSRQKSTKSAVAESKKTDAAPSPAVKKVHVLKLLTQLDGKEARNTSST